MNRKIAICFMLGFIILFLSTCGRTGSGDAPENSLGKPGNTPGESGNQGKTSLATPGIPGMKTDIGTADEILKKMSMEEKVGQLFMIAIRKDEKNNPIHHMNEAVKETLSEFFPGGIVLFADNIDTISQTRKLIEDLQSEAKVPMFIAADEEGGKVSRLNASGKMHATKLPGNFAIGKTGNTDFSYQVGVLLGKELSSLGFNMNFAPVADIHTNPENPVIGERSFGTDAGIVAPMVEAMVRGIQEQGVCAVLKHFPGHGDTFSDTHTGEVAVLHNMKRLEAVEFEPFKKGIEAGAVGVMTAHIQLPAILKEKVPATLSKEVVTGMLRDKLEFKGLIITDALEMGAILYYWTPGEAAVKAFKAGVDILLMPGSLEEAYYGILNAVSSGWISEERLDESVRRILQVKQDMGILEGKRSDLDPEKTLGSEEHRRLAEEIIEKSK